jgi:hypothetical protein
MGSLLMPFHFVENSNYQSKENIGSLRSAAPCEGGCDCIWIQPMLGLTFILIKIIFQKLLKVKKGLIGNILVKSHLKFYIYIIAVILFEMIFYVFVD